jgi:ABC-type sugar transport system permease subunit
VARYRALSATFLTGVIPAITALALGLSIWLLITSFWPDFSTAHLRLAWPFLMRTFVFTLVSATFQVAIGLLAALTILWVARSQLSRLLLTTIFLVPYAIPASIVGLAFRFGLGPQSAWAIAMSNHFGIAPDYWLFENAMFVATVVSIWQFFPFSFLICYLTLLSIPESMLRSARIDGAGFIRILVDIALARIWPVLLAVFLLRIVFMMVKFDTLFIFTEAILSDSDVATIELARAISGSTSPELNVIAWLLQASAFGVAIIYFRLNQRSIG